MKLLISLFLENEDGKTTNAVYAIRIKDEELKSGIVGKTFTLMHECIKEHESTGQKIISHSVCLLP